MLERKIIFCALSFVLTACSGNKPFQPPPSEYSQWGKDELPDEAVKQAMRECGYKDLYGYGGDKNATNNDIAKRENCMFQNGFKRKDKYKGICSLSLRGAEIIPACQGFIATPLKN